MRTLAIAAMAIAVVSLGAAELLSPTPRDITSLDGLVGSRSAHACPIAELGRSIPAAGVRYAIWGGYATAYDSTNGTTLVLTRYCNHALIAPAVILKGNWTGRDIAGPLLLVPSGDLISVYPATLPENMSQRGPPIESLTALGPMFEASSPWPSFLAKAGLLALLFAGIAFASRAYRFRTSAIIAVAAGAGIVAASFMRGNLWLFVGLLMLPLVPLGLAMLVWVGASLARRMRPHPVALALLLGVIGFFATAYLTLLYFPANGAGD